MHGRSRCGWSHGDINIFEELTRCDATQAIGRLDQIVARLSSVFPAERIEETDRLGELAGSN